jgi:hypothetical protein
MQNSTVAGKYNTTGKQKRRHHCSTTQPENKNEDTIAVQHMDLNIQI